MQIGFSSSSRSFQRAPVFRRPHTFFLLFPVKTGRYPVPFAEILAALSSFRQQEKNQRPAIPGPTFTVWNHGSFLYYKTFPGDGKNIFFRRFHSFQDSMGTRKVFLNFLIFQIVLHYFLFCRSTKIVYND
jgi:hypothetical protein